MVNELEILDILLKADNKVLKELGVDYRDLNDIGLFKTDSKWEVIRDDKSNLYQIGFIMDNSYDASDIQYTDMARVIEVLKKHELI